MEQVVQDEDGVDERDGVDEVKEAEGLKRISKWSGRVATLVFKIRYSIMPYKLPFSRSLRLRSRHHAARLT
jgi:hypothetical protein